MVTPGESVDRHSLTGRWLPSRGHESAAIGPRAVMECHSGLEETPQDPVDVLHLNFECEPKYLSRLHILSTFPRKPHSEPHMSSMQCPAATSFR